MSRLLRLIHKSARDEEGAALIEYTALLGILLVGVIVAIGLVGGWVSGQWNALNSAL